MSETPAPLDRFIDFLRRAGMEPTAEEISEMLWLAARLPVVSGEARPVQGAPPPVAPPPLPPVPARQSVPPSRSETFEPSNSSVSASAQGSPATTDLYPEQAGTREGGQAARSIRSPAAFALPGSLELGRSLRPLKRRVPSRSRLVFDEAATAHRIADTGEWNPVLRYAPERWLDVILLADESSSMVIWQRTLTELRSLLERQGAFRKIELLGFRPVADDTGIQIYTGTGATADRKRLRRSNELVDPLGRRLIAVVSDCVSRIWHNGVMAGLLSDWGSDGPAAIVQVLPERLWVRTGLRSYPPIYLRSPAPGTPNAQFEIEWTSYRPKPPGPRGIAVPVVSLEALSLGSWARAIAGNSNLWIPGVFAISAAPVRVPGEAQPVAPPRVAATIPPAQIVNLFYGTASPVARLLATTLAAVPLTLPVMRLVQRAVLPDSRQVHFAEIWLSGLIDRPAEIDDKTPADEMEYRFVNGVRELLLNNLRLSEAIDVLKIVSNYVGERIGQPMDFGALIADPTASGDVQIAQGYKSFGQIAATVLGRFGGPYANLAQRLDISIHGKSSRTVESVSRVKVGIRAANARVRKSIATVRALLVGINDHLSKGIPQLKGAANDVELTQSWLQTQWRVSPSNITVLTDRQATKQAIVRAWRSAIAQMEEGDQFFVHFSGNDQQIASSDPNEADGLEETLVVYDSVPGERPTLLTLQELADLAAEAEDRGGQTIILLDSCRMASGLLSRRALGDTLVFAGAAEAELSVEVRLGGKTHGAVSYFLAEAMRNRRPGMTWLDAHESVLANIRRLGYRQTPQLIGMGDMAVFGPERKAAPPHLLVTNADEREIEIYAPAALVLRTGENGARLAIYPPGSAMDGQPMAYCRVKRATRGGVIAVCESPAEVPVASRVRVLEYGDPDAVIRVGVSSELQRGMGPSPLVAFTPPDSGETDFTVAVVNDGHVIRDRAGEVLWREPAVSPTGTESHARRTLSVLEHVATYLRTFAAKNRDAGSALAGKIDLEVIQAASGNVIALEENEPLTLRLSNQSQGGVYISVWMFDDHMGIQRVFPAATTCVLLGKERNVQLAVTVRQDEDHERPERFTFKVFASAAPVDLGMLSLPRLDRPFEIGDLTAWSGRAPALDPAKPSRKAVSKAASGRMSSEQGWVPGGPVGVTARLWKTGGTLRIKFLKGDSAIQSRVRAVALEWTRYANLKFDFVTSGDSDLRVSFDAGGSWSYVGTDSSSIPQDQTTINLGWLTSTTSDEELRTVVLHEFGHALGLAAAQQSPIAEIPWNKKAAYEYYAKLGWDRQTVDANVFAKYDLDQVQYGPADPHSIMYHPIPKETTDGKIEIVQGSQLSEGDKQFIAQLYPRVSTR